MALTTDMRRGWLRALQINLAETGLSLSDALNAALVTPASHLNSGRLVLSTSANGQSVSFAGPGQGSMTPSELLGLVSWMIDRMNDASTALGGTPTDAELVTQMLAYMRPIRSYTAHYTTLRTANDG